MKAVVLERYGTPDVLRLKDVEKPAPKAGEVLVRVHAASINDWDYAMLRGDSFVTRMLHGIFTPKVPIIGGDIAGRVEAVAPEASLTRKPASMKPNKDLGYVNQLFESGMLVPVVDRTYTLAEVPDALRFFGSGDHKGKIVISIQ